MSKTSLLWAATSLLFSIWMLPFHRGAKWWIGSPVTAQVIFCWWTPDDAHDAARYTSLKLMSIMIGAVTLSLCPHKCLPSLDEYQESDPFVSHLSGVETEEVSVCQKDPLPEPTCFPVANTWGCPFLTVSWSKDRMISTNVSRSIRKLLQIGIFLS